MTTKWSRAAREAAHALLLALAAAAASVSPATAELDVPGTWEDHAAGVRTRYVSGGVGLDSREALAALVPSYSAQLIFADSEGRLVAGVEVLIRDAAGRVVFRMTESGPWLLLGLPPGRHAHEVRWREHRRSGSFDVPEGRSVRAVVVFPAEPEPARR